MHSDLIYTTLKCCKVLQSRSLTGVKVDVVILSEMIFESRAELHDPFDLQKRFPSRDAGPKSTHHLSFVNRLFGCGDFMIVRIDHIKVFSLLGKRAVPAVPITPSGDEKDQLCSDVAKFAPIREVFWQFILRHN